MTKLDLRKQLKEFYQPPARKFTIADIPALNFVMIDGRGDPNTSEAYRQAIEALYSLAYTLKFMLKKESDQDFTVLPLEGLWWGDDMAHFADLPKDTWKWTMMIALPDFVTRPRLQRAREQAVARKPLPGLELARLERFREGRSAQTTYIGPFADEGPTIAALHAFIRENGYVLAGKHHEIYMSDPRRTAPSKFKTVIRQPMKRAPK